MERGIGMQKLLIADSCPTFRAELSAQLQKEYAVITASNGAEALRIAVEQMPDLMVLDLMMPELDGLAVLQGLKEHHIYPNVLAITRFTNSFIEEKLSQLGVGYLMIKPCQARTVAERVRDMDAICSVLGNGGRNTCQVTQMLLRLGVPTKLHGFSYMRQAIHFLMENSNLQLTKELYPDVGRVFGAGAMQVERAIRSAIGITWQKRDDAAWGQLFGYDTLGTVQKPTNAEFLFRLAEVLKNNAG